MKFIFTFIFMFVFFLLVNVAADLAAFLFRKIDKRFHPDMCPLCRKDVEHTDICLACTFCEYDEFEESYDPDDMYGRPSKWHCALKDEKYLDRLETLQAERRKK